MIIGYFNPSMPASVHCNDLQFFTCFYVHYGDLVLRELDYIVTISFGYILYCVCFNLYSDGFQLFCNVWVCVCVCVCVDFVMCGCPDNVYTLNLFGYRD
jgi:hypothetical protein